MAHRVLGVDVTQPDDGVAAFEDAKPKLMAIAYRMLGSVVEAEDVVGDVAEGWAADGPATEVRIPEAWLVTATTRRALDVLRSACLQRESYPGVWLPEPIATDEGARRRGSKAPRRSRWGSCSCSSG